MFHARDARVASVVELDFVESNATTRTQYCCLRLAVEVAQAVVLEVVEALPPQKWNFEPVAMLWESDEELRAGLTTLLNPAMLLVIVVAVVLVFVVAAAVVIAAAVSDPAAAALAATVAKSPKFEYGDLLEVL